ncbi:helix-turn-helix transcriptional regulator [Actinoplanes sp. LDG1-06]|uniref:Helix-turn-helix transcriptional regulator n=1 Tax=Paractinoplanes ovalisporus TaxID=2810368 RepID=A0ABS2AV89_9ACTN|nr:helix-turn-helix transcriptional regulator [Actinoplanes ovalisporus]MBM2623106.1 helix-turn-helix transcriptional regulator [Actinoplanes ovalisporus]
MQPTEDPAVELSARLRNLRLDGLGLKITQGNLARALDCSIALISSWERPVDPVTPPIERIEQYATFFSTPRSVEKKPFRLLPERDLAPVEVAQRAELLGRLTRLRDAAAGDSPAVNWVNRDTLVGRGPWYFPNADPERPVVLVCPQLPPKELAVVPHGDPADPDYSELSRLTDLDALLELYGHIRAVNPDLRVEFRSVASLRRDDTTGHLVVLGGVDWNAASKDIMWRINAPITQISEKHPMNRGCFRVTDDASQSYTPVVEQDGDRQVLLEDVGYFFRGPNPYNSERTVTLCNGMFGRGVLGTVRALTDRELRDKNADFLEHRFGDHDSYSILFRVPVLNERVVVTPDWNNPHTVLHTWSEKSE